MGNQQASANRQTAATRMNDYSSRSHGIFILTIQQRHTETGSTQTGKLFIVDLAGSEKIRKTGAEGSRLEEAKKINLSLPISAWTVIVEQ